MDEYLDQFLSSSSWSDVNVKESSSWVCSDPDETNGMLPSSVGMYEADEENSTLSMINSSLTMEGFASQDTSIALGAETDFDLDKALLFVDSQSQQDGKNCEGNRPLNGVVNGNVQVRHMGLPPKAATSIPSSQNLSSAKQVPIVSGMDRSPLSFSETNNVGCNGSKPSVFQSTVGNIMTIPPVPQLWLPPSYGSVSSLSTLIGQDKMQGSGMHAEYAYNEIDVMGNRYIGNHKTLQRDNLVSASKGNEELKNQPFSSFGAGPQITMTRAGLQSLPQLLELSEGNPIKHYGNQAYNSQLQTTSTPPSGGCYGTGKPRVRARRGQATDPHSIAERLRREKISERMKNLQELVPNSNKTDKASMLDEIIEYVRFLQLQVKVLSMSRLGAAGAVVPLITDCQTEGPDNLLSQSAIQGADISQSFDHTAFEQEVAKLMESNISTAMQYLQTKGLCLMPIALASAISRGKALPSAPVSEERKKVGSPGNETHQDQMSSNDNVVNGKLSNGAVLKQEGKKASETSGK